jgi:hypothetical protein
MALSPFQSGLNAIFSSQIAIDAVYVARTGVNTPLRTVSATEESVDGFGVGFVKSDNRYDVLVSSISQPAEDDSIITGEIVAGVFIPAATFKVKSFKPDAQKLTWHLTVEKTA